MTTEISTAPDPTGERALRRGLDALRDELRGVFEPRLLAATRAVIDALDRDPQAAALMRRAARTLLDDHRAFAAGFYAELEREYDAVAADLLAGTVRPAGPASAAPALAMQAGADVEDALRAARAADRIRRAAEGAYEAATQRVAALLGVDWLGDDVNPLHPVRYCRAAGAALRRAGFEGAARSRVAAEFETALQAPLLQTYEELDRRLERRGVDPETAEVAIRRIRPPDSTPPVSTVDERSGEGSAARAAPVVPVAPELLLAALERGREQPAAEREGGRDPALLVLVDDALRSMLPPGRGSSSPDVSHSVRLRRRLSDAAAREDDRMTIEWVGRLFDRLARDPVVPAALRGALAHLELPLLRLALTDPALLAEPAHPARRLIDRIGVAAAGGGADAAEGARLAAEVQAAVERIVREPEPGRDTWEWALAEFERFLAEDDARDEETLARARWALEDAETRALMAVEAADGVRRALRGVALDGWLRTFLLHDWVHVLVAATLRERTQPAYAQRFRSAVSELVWSVAPKNAGEERKQLVKLIPGLLGTLREGLQLIEVPSVRSQAFLGRLMTAHARAVRATAVEVPLGDGADGVGIRRRLDEMRIAEPPHPEGVDERRPVDVPAELAHAALSSFDAGTDLLEDPPGAPADAAAQARMPDAMLDAIIDGWERGTWLAFGVVGRRIRMRLRWRTPHGNVLLLSPADGGRALAATRSALRAHLRARRLEAVEPLPLFERTLGRVMQDLRQAAAAGHAGAAGEGA